MLTFEEFMSIAPCAQGKHSTTDLPPKIEKKKAAADADAALAAERKKNDDNFGPAMPRTPIAMPTREKTEKSQPVAAAPAPAEKATEVDEEDDPTLEIPDGRTCQRRGCNATYTKGTDRSATAPDENCEHHPGAPIFHEGSKGYSCCKRRVLEFDQFMKIEGCHKKPRHLFVGRKKAPANAQNTEGGEAGEEEVKDVRFDFYQSATSLTVSFFLKKIDKERAVVTFEEQSVSLDLPTTDAKRYRKVVSLYGPIDTAKSRYSIMGTKLEVVLAKAAVSSWPVLRSDDRPTGEIFQVARAGKIER